MIIAPIDRRSTAAELLDDDNDDNDNADGVSPGDDIVKRTNDSPTDLARK
jgi:hypothetical protein